MSDPIRDHDSFDSIESLIRAAGNYVQPTRDLRPRVLEAAREHCDDRRAEQKLGAFAIALLLLASFSSPAIRYVALMRTASAGPSAIEMHRRALAYEAQADMGANWGLTEAFSELRRAQANRLGR